MIVHDESAFRFAFGESWVHVERWDESRVFTSGVCTVQSQLDGRVEGTKALDFVGLCDAQFWLFEIKDFRIDPRSLPDA